MGIRITNVCEDIQENRLIASDDTGHLYALDRTLVVQQRSPSTYFGGSIHNLLTDDSGIFTRDVSGNIIKWDRRTLQPKEFLVSEHFSVPPEAGVTAMPAPSGAMAIAGDELLVANAYGQIAIFDKHQLLCKKAVTVPSEAFPECLNVESDDETMLISDCGGMIWSANLHEERFERMQYIPTGNMHCIKRDRLHDRYWCTSDTLGGVGLLENSGKLVDEVTFTNDDVERILFSPDYTHAYVGCFDHYVYILKNDLKPMVIDKIGPFKFQINHMTSSQDGCELYVVLESGELYIVDTAARCITHQAFGTDAIWGIDERDGVYYCAMEDGNVALVELLENGAYAPNIVMKPLPDLGLGRVRKALPLDGGRILAITTSGSIVLSNETGEILWKRDTSGILRDVDVSQNGEEAVACNESGELIMFRTSDGAVLGQMQSAKPIWCVSYDYEGHIMYGERAIIQQINQREAEKTAFVILDEKTLSPVKEFAFFGNFKRIRRLAARKMLINGNGEFSVRLFDLATLEFEYAFSEWMINTPENALVINNHLYVVTYSKQINVYDLATNEIVSSQFATEGYPLGMNQYQSANGKAYLLVGGRNFFSLYDVSQIAPSLVRTMYLR